MNSPTLHLPVAQIIPATAQGAATFTTGGRVIKCPDMTMGQVRESVFVGGGITGCPDWQVDFCSMVIQAVTAARKDMAFELFNPRRDNFPIDDPNASYEQIRWEWNLLKAAKAVSMWFPKHSEGPISLFELGRWLCNPKPIYVGIENGYPREIELRASVEALRPGLPISTSLELHAAAVANYVLGRGYNRATAVRHGEPNPGRVYLAGGIKECPDWQNDLEKLLSGIEGLSTCNPRVAGFIPRSSDDYTNMVKENRRNLESCGAVIFWFPKNMLTPVALCELGAEIARERPLFIGIEEGYKRSVDVQVQTGLERPDIQIVNSLEDLAHQVRGYYESLRRGVSSSAQP